MNKISSFFKKMNLSSNLRRFFFFLVVILFMEMVFALTIFDNYLKESIINIFLFSIILASFLSIITGIFNDKINKVLTSTVLGLLGLFFSIQLVFYNTFKTFFSFSILGLGDQLESFMKETFTAIIHNFFYILLLFLPFIIYLIFKKKINLKRNGVLEYVSFLVFIILSLSLYLVHINSTKGVENGTYALLHDVNYVELNYAKLGVNNSYLIDIYRSIFGFNEKIVEEKAVEEKKESIIKYDKNILELNLDKATGNSEIKTINNYIKNDAGTDKNKYTGLFKGYNLIYITAESFSEIAVSEELTPTLYKLTHSGFVFKNYYTPNTLSTIGGEFQSLTGLYPDSSILNTWRKGSNYFPFGLATTYRKLGYNTYAYHNNWYGFQDRHKYLKSQGFTNYLGCYNGLEKRMNCKAWPQSDLEMMKATVKDYINSDKPFLAYYMTVSGHFAYNFSDNSMAYKNRGKVNKLKGTTAAKAFVATQIELDKALEYLISELEKNNKLDNTVIVLLADHYPYKLSLNDINSLSSYKRDSVVSVNHNNLILWNNRVNDIDIDKPCMSSDVIPTVYNLFGIDYDSRLFTGRDILSDSDGLVIFNNRSWVTDKGTYYSGSGKFIPKGETPSSYVANINNVVKNRLAIAKYIIKNNYYNYLFK